MKTVFTTFLVFSGLSFAFAASGACSGHGGVSCSAGQDSDGSVICMDGWRNSSVSYASMVKCGGYNTPEPVPAVAPTVVPKTTPVPVTVPKEEPRVVTKPASTPGSKPLVTKPVATSSPKAVNQAQKATSSPVAKATTTPVFRPIATSSVESPVIVAPSPVKEVGVFSVFRKFKFW